MRSELRGSRKEFQVGSNRRRRRRDTGLSLFRKAALSIKIFCLALPATVDSVCLLAHLILLQLLTLQHATMASSEVTSALLALEDRPASQKTKGYNDLLAQLTKPSASTNEQGSNLVVYIDSLLESSLGIIAVRPLLTTLIQSLTSRPANVKVEVGSHLVTVLQPQLASFEEQDATVREILAGGYEAEEDWSQAAKALQGIQLDSTQRTVSDTAKVQTWVRIVRYYLEDDDTVSAETALNKIKNSGAATQVLQSSPDLQLHYQLSQARILDSRRDFLNASAEYLNVSFNGSVAEDDRLQALSASIKTAILAPAGPQRSRTLAKLVQR